MMKQGCWISGFIMVSVLLSGCVGSLWTGASMIYDRHNIYKKIGDYRVLMDVTEALYCDKKLKCDFCSIDITVFNGDVLIAGHLPNEEILSEANLRLSQVKGYRRLFNQLRLNKQAIHLMQDTWITTKIRSQIFADDHIDPKAFKVVTVDGIVYLLGDVKPDQAEKVTRIARHTTGVDGVVKMMKYFTYESKNKEA